MTAGSWRLAAVLTLLVAPALAQPLPATRPLRDVVVTYVLDGQAPASVPGGIPGPVTLSWDAAGQRLRAEAEGRSQVALIDLRNRSGQVIDTALRMVLPLPIRASDLQPLLLDETRLHPRGKDRVAGLACTVAVFETAHGPGTVCLTADGVPLRGEGRVGGKPGRFTAVAVRYGAVAPELFVVPPGYMALGRNGHGGLAGLQDLRGLLGRSR